MSLLANMRGDRITEETYQKYYPWLKSLRPSWKPSEEQMAILEKAVKHYRFDFTGVTVKEQVALTSLLSDLKKLM